VTISTGDLWAETGFGSAQGAVYGWTWNDVDLDAEWDDGESALEGWTVFLDIDKDGQLDAGETSTTTDANGYYVFGGLSPGEYTVAQVMQSGWRQTWPADASHTVTVTAENLWAETYFGNHELPVVTIAASDADAAEAAVDTGTFTISRTGATVGDLTVQLSIGGSATETDDFLVIATTAVILTGQSSVAVMLTPVDDDVAESAETVTLTVEPDPAYAIGAAGTATVNIADNDNHSFQNLDNPTDVDDDGDTTPLDVLLIINDINAGGARTLPDQRDDGQSYVDVNGDGSITPVDVLVIINSINGQSAGSGEGEAATEAFAYMANRTVSEGEAGLDQLRFEQNALDQTEDTGSALSSHEDGALFALSELELPSSAPLPRAFNAIDSVEPSHALSNLQDVVQRAESTEQPPNHTTSLLSEAGGNNDTDPTEWEDLLTEIARDVCMSSGERGIAT